MKYLNSLVYLLLLFGACKDPVSYVKPSNNSINLVNNSDIRLAGFVRIPPVKKNGSIDTLLPENFPNPIGFASPRISGELNSFKGTGEDIFEANDTICIYIFEKDSLFKYPWDIVRDQYKILARYDFRFEDLKNLNYNVPYPATGKLPNIRIYPR